MAISKERKEQLVTSYIDLLNNSKAIFVTEYTGLNVKQLGNLREEVRKADGTFRITKNTLLRHALEETGMPVPEEMLTGQVATGFALSEAPSLAKALTEFAKDEEQLVIKGAIMGNEILGPDSVAALAKLPSLDELRAQIIGLLSAPAQSVTSAVASGVRQVLNVLDAYANTESSDQAEATA